MKDKLNDDSIYSKDQELMHFKIARIEESLFSTKKKNWQDKTKRTKSQKVNNSCKQKNGINIYGISHTLYLVVKRGRM